MGLPGFNIVLDSPTSSYYAGSSLTGRVLLNLDKPKKVRALTVKFKGASHVSWNESHDERQNDGSTRSETVTFSASEEYFTMKFNLVGSASGEVEIPAGENVYPFSTALPPLLPSSFDGEYGHVKYTIEAVLDRPWKLDHEVKTRFFVVTPLDLNLHPEVKEPVKQDREKTFCCCCCRSGPLTVVVALPFTGFVPGQPIPFTVEIDNASNVEIDKVAFAVKKMIKWTAHTPRHSTKDDTVEVVKLEIEGVPAGGSKSWNQTLPLPEMPFHNLNGCSIINLTYKFQVTAKVSGIHKDLNLSIPIMLGSVPLMQSGFGGQPPLNGMSVSPITAVPAAPPSYNSPNYPPPSYHESVGQQPPVAFPPPGQMYPPGVQPYPPVAQPYPPVAQPYPPAQAYPPAPGQAYPSAPIAPPDLGFKVAPGGEAYPEKVPLTSKPYP